MTRCLVFPSFLFFSAGYMLEVPDFRCDRGCFRPSSRGECTALRYFVLFCFIFSSECKFFFFFVFVFYTAPKSGKHFGNGLSFPILVCILFIPFTRFMCFCIIPGMLLVHVPTLTKYHTQVAMMFFKTIFSNSELS